MPDIKVCTDNWNAVHGSTFKWHNVDQQDAATITQVTGATWPFTCSDPNPNPDAPKQLTIPASSKVDCGLINQTGTYQYDSNPCTTLGNPKTVIIT